MTDLMKEIQTEIQRIQDDFNRTLFHIVKHNGFIYEDLESSRRPETLLPVNQTIQYLDELKSVAHDFQARTTQSSKRIHELAERSVEELGAFRDSVAQDLDMIEAMLSNQTDENVLMAKERLASVRTLFHRHYTKSDITNYKYWRAADDW